jgi:Ca2+-transporting ATPase
MEIAPVHVAVRGRARFKIPALRRDHGLKHTLEAGLGGNGIRSVSASACTGNVLILFEPSHPLDEIERRVREVAARGPARFPSILTEGPPWHSIDAEKVLATLDSRASGLTSAAANARLRRHGANLLTKIARRTGSEILLDQFGTLPVALLAGTALISLMTGGLMDAAIVLAVIAVNGIIGFVSETWTEQTIASLEGNAVPTARVRREGNEQVVPAEPLVPGDVIALHGSDVVPADARVITADRLTVNEAALTGESLPVAKAANVLAAVDASLADRRNMLYRGSIVTGGSGSAVVVATGDRTEIARVQALLGNATRPETPLQAHLDRLGRQLAVSAVGASALMFVIGLLRGQPWLLMLRSAVSLGVAAVPEGLPTMVTTALAVGVRRLRSRDLLVRRIEAIEGLGSVQLVCFDKTGTLTLNRMTVTRLRWNGQEARLAEEEYRGRDGNPIAYSRDPDLARLIQICVLCNDATLPGSASDAAPGSSTEAALLEVAGRLGAEVEALRESHPRISTVERAAGRRYMATLHATPQGETLIAVKGDPMAVLALCGYRSQGGKQHRLDAAAREAIEADNLAMAQAGLRVLGIAFRRAPADEESGSALTDLVWLGLVGMADPIRRGAAELVHALQRAGIATVMLTGDQRATAVAIAAELGLSPSGDAEIVEGDQLGISAMPGNAPRIFARLTPAQKLQVIADLQRSGQRVAMVGDGVNDTPALKVADVGITLAASATDIARDVADIVLLGDDLAPLAFAFEAGRSVHGNIRQAIRFLIATNLSEIFMMLFAVGSGLMRPLSPGQLLWINLLSDVLPALGLALEPPDPELMARPLPAPAPILSSADLPLLTRDAGLIAGSSIAAQASAAILRGSAAADAVGFTSLVTGQLLYALACAPKGRPTSGNLIGALAASFGAQAAALSLPRLRRLVGGRLDATGVAFSAAAGLLPLLLVSAFDSAGSAGGGASRQASEPSASNA